MKTKKNTTNIDPESYGPSNKWVLATGGVILLLVLGLLLPRFFSSDDHEDHDSEEVQWYISGMHPWIIQPEPGNCPVCGMELTPLRPDMLTGTLSIDPLLVQNIGVRIASAVEEPFTDEIRIFVTFNFAEDSLQTVSTRSGAYLEKLYANQVGMTIEEGTVLADLHSPEVYSAAKEWLGMLQRETAKSAMDSTRSRLKILGVPSSTLEEWEKEKEISWTYPIKARQNGVVLSLFSREGDFIGQGSSLLEYASMDPLWLDLGLYPTTLKRLEPGMEGKLVGTNEDESVILLDIIYPTVDPVSRLGRGRAILENPDLQFRPGAFHTVIFHEISSDPVILIPREALLSTGKRNLVYVSLGDGRFEPREVVPGRESSTGNVEILNGLSANESVVVSGQFLLDSESRLRESLLKLVKGETAAEQRVQLEVDDSGRPPLPNELDEIFGDWLRTYLELGEVLAADEPEKLDSLTNQLRDQSEQLQNYMNQHARHLPSGWDHMVGSLQKASITLAETTTMRDARIALRSLSEPLREWIQSTGVPHSLDSPLHEIRCPMFPELGENAWWLQTDSSTRNPYMGKAMLTCADQRNPLPPAGGDANASVHEVMNGEDGDQ